MVASQNVFNEMYTTCVEVRKKVPRVTIFPKSHYVTPRETMEKAIDKIRDELSAKGIQLKDGKDGTTFSLN